MRRTARRTGQTHHEITAVGQHPSQTWLRDNAQRSRVRDFEDTSPEMEVRLSLPVHHRGAGESAKQMLFFGRFFSPAWLIFKQAHCSLARGPRGGILRQQPNCFTIAMPPFDSRGVLLHTRTTAATIVATIAGWHIKCSAQDACHRKASQYLSQTVWNGHPGRTAW